MLNMLGDAGPDGAKVQRELRRLLPLKTSTEYEPDEVAAGVARKAVERSFALCGQMAQVVAAGVS